MAEMMDWATRMVEAGDDDDKFLKLYTEDVILSFPVSKEPIFGREGEILP